MAHPLCHRIYKNLTLVKDVLMNLYFYQRVKYLSQPTTPARLPDGSEALKKRPSDPMPSREDIAIVSTLESR
jgi:hypothetical protein